MNKLIQFISLYYLTPDIDRVNIVNCNGTLTVGFLHKNRKLLGQVTGHDILPNVQDFSFAVADSRILLQILKVFDNPVLEVDVDDNGIANILYVRDEGTTRKSTFVAFAGDVKTPPQQVIDNIMSLDAGYDVEVDADFIKHLVSSTTIINGLFNIDIESNKCMLVNSTTNDVIDIPITATKYIDDLGVRGLSLPTFMLVADALQHECTLQFKISSNRVRKMFAVTKKQGIFDVVYFLPPNL